MATARRAIENFLVNNIGIDRWYFTDFEFHSGHTPLSAIKYPMATVLIYCIGIPLLQSFMKGRKSPSINGIITIHNLFLALSSFCMAIFLFCTILSYSSPEYGQYSYSQIFCALNHNQQKGTLSLLYYINYLLKYYELLDTVFLALKHKSINFLHGYHHPATLVLCWTQLIDSTGVQWVVIFLNLCVHSVMYTYYFVMSAKLTIFKPHKWKMLVTLMQIGQFLIDLTACYYAAFQNRLHNACVGTSRAALIGGFILNSYLYLFFDFFDQAYSKNNALSLKTIFVSMWILFISLASYLLSIRGWT